MTRCTPTKSYPMLLSKLITAKERFEVKYRTAYTKTFVNKIKRELMKNAKRRGYIGAEITLSSQMQSCYSVHHQDELYGFCTTINQHLNVLGLTAEPIDFRKNKEDLIITIRQL